MHSCVTSLPMDGMTSPALLSGIFLAATLTVLAACGSTEDPGIGFDSRRGQLTVFARTTGEPLPEGPYVVEATDIPFESERPKPTADLAPNGEVTFSNLLAPAVWTVTIREIPVECSLVGEASRDVAVGAGRTAAVTYEVVCGG